MENRASVANLATVAILPASSDVPLTNFTLELQHALKAIGKAHIIYSPLLNMWIRLQGRSLQAVWWFLSPFSPGGGGGGGGGGGHRKESEQILSF